MKAFEIFGYSFPPQARMSSDSTIKRYLSEYFEHKGFFETKRGKWVRENVFHNADIVRAMKVWFDQNEYKVLKTTTESTEDAMYLTARHAADHLMLPQPLCGEKLCGSG